MKVLFAKILRKSNKATLRNYVSLYYEFIIRRKCFYIGIWKSICKTSAHCNYTKIYSFWYPCEYRQRKWIQTRTPFSNKIIKSYYHLSTLFIERWMVYFCSIIFSELLSFYLEAIKWRKLFNHITRICKILSDSLFIIHTYVFCIFKVLMESFSIGITSINLDMPSCGLS